MKHCGRLQMLHISSGETTVGCARDGAGCSKRRMLPLILHATSPLPWHSHCKHPLEGDLIIVCECTILRS